MCDETFEEHVTVLRTLTVEGAGQGATILDGLDAGQVIIVDEASFTLRDLTVQNGTGPRFGGNCAGGGVTTNESFGQVHSLLIERVDFYGNATAVCVDDNINATVIDSTFIDNVGSQGGGIFSYGTLAVDGSTFTNNVVTNHGGGLYLSYGSTTIDNSVVRNNGASEGGGVYMQSPATLNVTNSDFGAGELLENTPDDVGCYVDTFGFFGADSDFTCSVPEYDECSCTVL